jgi:hypothetical protein
MPSVSLGLTCNWAWQNLVTSGWQAARSLSLPWFAGGGGCGGNVWAFTAAAAKTKAIDSIDIRIMVPPFAGIRPVATITNLSHTLPALSCGPASPLGCAQKFASLCDRAATTMWQRACAFPQCGDTSRRPVTDETCSGGRLAQLVERLLYTQDVGGSSPSPPTSLRSFLRGASSAETVSSKRVGTGFSAVRSHGSQAVFYKIKHPRPPQFLCDGTRAVSDDRFEISDLRRKVVRSPL